MDSDITMSIERWFADHVEDGEFDCDPAKRFSVLAPRAVPARFVFTTKPDTVSHAVVADGATTWGMIGRYGLPREADTAWISGAVADHELLFLGDMDPVDLLVYAWLRERLSPKRVTFLGVCDAYLSALAVSLPESFILPCSISERQSLPLLRRVLPDVREFVGRRCMELLDAGCKIELEAVASARDSAAAILSGATRDKQSAN